MPSLVQNIMDSVRGRRDEGPDIMARAAQFVDWAGKPQHQEFLDWLYDQADAPIDIRTDHQGLIAFTARANTFKEIRRYLMDQESRANRALNREQHG